MKSRSVSPGTYLLLAVLLILVTAPLVWVLAVSVTGYGSDPSAIGSIFSAQTGKVLGNTVLLSVLVVLFATLMAAPLAYLSSWTQFRHSSAIDLLVMVPFMTPPFVSSLAWMDLVRPRGPVWQVFGKGFQGGLHNFIFSIWGMAFIMAGEIFTLLYLILRTAMINVPASTMEMAEVAGASRWQRARQIVIPQLVGPYSLGALIVFIRAAGEFGTPVTLGNAIGFQVLVSSVHQDVTVDPLNFSHAAAGSTVLFVLGVTVWGLQQWISRIDTDQGGRASRRYAVSLKAPGKTAGWAWVTIIALLSVIIPLVSIVLGAMTILRSKPPTANNLSFDYFSTTLSNPAAQEALRTSAVLGLLAATLSVVLAIWVTITLMRGKSWLSRLTDFVAVSPDTIPAIVLAIGFILLWNSSWLPWTPYGTKGILVMAYAAIFLPTAVQNVKASAAGVSSSLIEAATVSGASRWQLLTRIVVPMLAPGIIAGWLLAFLVGIRELVMSSLVRPANLNLLAPFIMNQFEQGHRNEAMVMTLIGVVSSTIVLVAVTAWQRRRQAQEA